MKRYADYVYENKEGTRINIQKVCTEDESALWNVYWVADGEIKSFFDCGDAFYTKRDAKKWASFEFGPIKSINPKGTWAF